MKRLLFDFETRSTADLRKQGAYKYSLDPSTKPTCLAIKILGFEQLHFFDVKLINKEWILLPEAFRKVWIRLIKERYEFTAHNVFFERCIYSNILVRRYGWPEIPENLYRCTAAKAAACALPRSLEGAGEALRLSVQKDRQGYIAMMATCKPAKAWTAWKGLQARIRAGEKMTAKTRAKAQEPEPRQFLEYDADPRIWQTLYEYCKKDVLAEEALDRALPDLIPQEQEVWHLNQKLNWRGLRLDIPTIRKIVSIIESDKTEKLVELDRLTMGLVRKPGARQSILEFLELENIKLPDLRAATVDSALAGFELSPDMRKLLELRKALSLASTKKYYSFLDRACPDDRARDLVIYHGASTGRDAGSGINPYNFPRGLIRVDKDRPYAAVENVVECDPEMLKLLYGSSLGLVFSAILRNMIIPSDGCELFVADFSKIEVAVLWWLADHARGLEILQSGLDVYKVQAAENLGLAWQTKEDLDRLISDDSMDRQTAKAQILGCGFRMSWKKFRDSSLLIHRLKLTNRQAVDAVKNYRESHKPVVSLWDAYENAAVTAVETGETQVAGHCRFSVARDFLWITLPSGRNLAYREPQIVMRSVSYTALEEDMNGKEIEVEKIGHPKKTLQFLGLDKTKKKLQTEFTHGGVLTENIVQATARDLMMPALLRLEKKDYRVLLSVYDEGVCEKEKGKGSVDEFVKILCEVPHWAKGLPLSAKGWCGYRYRK